MVYQKLKYYFDLISSITKIINKEKYFHEPKTEVSEQLSNIQQLMHYTLPFDQQNKGFEEKLTLIRCGTNNTFKRQ